ncbi:MAG: alcohol dehydrogenase-like regulatory protein ErcA [Desulfovibrionales bacterium]
MNSDINLSLRKFVAPEFVFGSDARFLAAQYARNFGAKRILVVTDPGVIAAGWTSQIVNDLESEGFPCTIFQNVSPNPREQEVMSGADLYAREGCNAIVSVGGGSPMDCAKGIGIVSANGGHILDYEGVDMIDLPLPPLIFIPTTAGTSADVSQFAIINDTARKVKIAIVSKTIVPDVALIDPVTTLTMDRELTAHTGLDAFTHAVEAYVSNANSPVSDTHALEAIRIISSALPQVVDTPDDLQCRGRMMLGSLFAGLAFSNASLGIVHAMAHSLGGLLDLPHGMCNAVLLQYAVAYNFQGSPLRFRRIAEAMELPVAGKGDEEVKDILVEGIARLRGSVGVDTTLGTTGISRETIVSLAEKSLLDACLVTNPLDVNIEDLTGLYEQAL